ALVSLFLVPVELPETATLKLQLALGASEPPLRTIVPVAAVTVRLLPVPPQALAVEFAATRTPAGSVSVKPTPLSVLAALGLLIVKVSVDVPLSSTDVGRKD